LWPKVLQLKEIAEQPSRAFGDDDHARLRDPLQARSKVRGLAYDAALLCFTRTEEVTHHHEPGRDPDTGLQGCAGLQPGHRCDQLKPRPYCPLGIVLMSLRIAEIHKHAVAHIFCHEPVEAAHGFGDAFLISRNDFSQIFGVHAGGECCRSNKVGKQHGYLPALGGVLRPRLGHGGMLSCDRDITTGKLSDRAQHLPAITENDTEVLQVLIRQVAKDRDINTVLGETVRVLGHAELVEPG